MLPQLDTAHLGPFNMAQQVTLTKARMSSVLLAATMFCLSHHDEYPTRTSTLLAYAASFPPDSPCRIHPEDLVDAWDKPIYFGVISGRLVLASAGRDGQFATEDDIVPPRNIGVQDAMSLNVRAICGGAE